MTALVPADNIAAVEALDPVAREVAVTHMLSEARSWLAHAVEATEPASIANFKAYVSSIEYMTKQLGLSKEIQQDAQAMVRRAERGVSEAVREGQDEGSIARRADHPFHGNQYAPAEVLGQNSSTSPRQFFSNAQEWSDSNQLADATEEEFEEALAEAKDEGNMSRANVVRKIKEKAAPPPNQVT
jgi:transcription initiation factor TFIIIB Brf1 subunit/transcription initiation factor TFIIB